MIKLSRLTDYAVVILAEMAQQKSALISVSSLSECLSLPRPTVSKTLKLMVKGGIVRSIRGVKGGYALKSSPHEILVSDIITAIEGPIALTPCVDSSHENCTMEGLCLLHGRWDVVNVALKTALDNITLEDMLPRSCSCSTKIPSFMEAGEERRL